MPHKVFKKEDLNNMVWGKPGRLTMARIIKEGLTATCVFKENSTGKFYAWENAYLQVEDVACLEMELREVESTRWMPVPEEENEGES